MKTLEITTAKYNTDNSGGFTAEQIAEFEAFACEYLQENLKIESVEISHGGNGLADELVGDGEVIERDSAEYSAIGAWMDKAYNAWIAQ